MYVHASVQHAYVCMRVCVCVHTFKSYVRVFRGFFNGWLCTLVLDYKFHNLILHSNFNPLAIPHTHTHTHTHTQIQRVHSGTMCVVKSGISILVLLFDLLPIFRICALSPPPPLPFKFVFTLKIQVTYSEEILLFILKQYCDSNCQYIFIQFRREISHYANNSILNTFETEPNVYFLY